MLACQFFLLHLFFQSFQLRAILTQTVAVYSSWLFLSHRAYGSLLHSHSSVVPMLLPHSLKKGSVHTDGFGAFSLCSLHRHAKHLLLSGFCTASTALKTSNMHFSSKHNLFCGPWDNTVLWRRRSDQLGIYATALASIQDSLSLFPQRQCVKQDEVCLSTRKICRCFQVYRSRKLEDKNTNCRQLWDSESS